MDTIVAMNIRKPISGLFQLMLKSIVYRLEIKMQIFQDSDLNRVQVCFFCIEVLL